MREFPNFSFSLWRDYGGERNLRNFVVSSPILIIFCMEAILAPRLRLNKYDAAMFIFGQRPFRAQWPVVPPYMEIL